MNGYQRYLQFSNKLIEKFLEVSPWFHPKSPDIIHHAIVPSATYAPWLSDDHFMSLYDAIKNHSLVDIYRCWELYTLGHQLSDINGCYLEVGVWRGGTGALLADVANNYGKTVYLADTFSGVVKASHEDTVYYGGEHSDTSVEIVQTLMQDLKLANVEILEGIFPDQTGDQIPQNIALLHCDVDVYESAAHIISFVQDRLCSGGVIVFDDYGFDSCVGITRLVNKLKSDPKWFFVHNLNGHALLIKK